MIEAFVQDIRYGVRTLMANPVATAAAVVSLGLGIGANTAIFTVVNAVLLTAMPVANADRLVQVYTLEWEFPGLFTGVSFANYEDYRDRSTSFSHLASIRPLTLNLVPADGEPEQISAQLVTASYFDVLGINPQLGRFFTLDEDERAVPVAVLSHAMWERRFGADPEVIGKTVNLGGIPFDVVGVGPRGFKGLNALADPDLIWIPMEMRSRVMTGLLARFFDLRRARFSQVIGRLEDGVTVQQARAEVYAISTRLEEEYPIDNRARWGDVQLYSPVNRNQRDQYARAGALMAAIVGLVLLIACANVANLLLARAADREKEIGIRIAIGADRGRLLRQLLTESLMLAALGGAAGVALATVATRALWAVRPPFLGAEAVELRLDPTVLGFTAGIAAVTGLIFGLGPALRASNPDLRSTLQEGGRRGSSGGSRGLLRSGLVVVEIALAVVALVGAGLFLRSLGRARHIDPGFESERLALLEVNLGNGGYDQGEARQFWIELLERLGSLPGVESASLQSGRLLGGGIPHTTFPEDVDIAEGRGIHVNDIVVHPDYFRTIGLQLLRGRLLSDLDRQGSALVAVINESTARLFWPDADPLGRRFRRSAEDPDWVYEVVGVVSDAMIDLAEGPEPVIYTALEQFPQSAAQVQIRTVADPVLVLGDVRRVVRSMDPALPILELSTISDDLEQALWAPRTGSALLSVFGGLALVLAVVGIYGVMSNNVRSRHHEIGLRLALGSSHGRVMGLILGQGMRLAVVGLLVGTVLALPSAGFVGSMLWGVGARDPATFVGVGVVLLLVTLVATALPAWRVTRVDPLVAIRDEY